MAEAFQKSGTNLLFNAAGDAIGIKDLDGSEYFFGDVRGSALVADDVTASISVPTSPTAFVWPNVRNSNPDVQYNATNGVFTFTEDVFFNSTANWHVHGASSKSFYADAETSLDGVTWTRGVNSLRVMETDSGGTTASFGFNGFFPKGLRLRFIWWASATGVDIRTEVFNGSTSAAARLTVNTIIGKKI
jgi:hypothetical protein